MAKAQRSSGRVFPRKLVRMEATIGKMGYIV